MGGLRGTLFPFRFEAHPLEEAGAAGGVPFYLRSPRIACKAAPQVPMRRRGQVGFCPFGSPLPIACASVESHFSMQRPELPLVVDLRPHFSARASEITRA